MRATPADLATLVTALRSELTEPQVVTDVDRCVGYANDASGGPASAPDLIVYPLSTHEVSRVFTLCQQYRIPFTPVGARTGKSGGCVPVFGGASVSLERMNRLLSLSMEDLVAVAQPGLITGDLMKAAQDKGLFYPPDPNSWESCTLGGNIAENAGGPRALKYGVTRDYVLGLEWVLPSGQVLRVGRQTIKGVAGYDLVGLFVGSEGTLGVATEITVQLLPTPRCVKTALVCFAATDVASRAVTAVLSAGVLPRTLELLDDVSVAAVAAKGVAFPEGTQAALILEVDGHSEEAVFEELAVACAACEAGGALTSLVAQDGSQREKLWAARRLLSVALGALTPYKLSEDIVVPRSRIPEYIERAKALGAGYGLQVATYGHAGDGNLHTNILFRREDERPVVDEAARALAALAVELGGTITGEHGVGLTKRNLMALEQPEPLLALQRSIKGLLDPTGLMNPGKLFPAANSADGT